MDAKPVDGAPMAEMIERSSFTNGEPVPLRRRAAALVLTIIAHLLLLLMLIRLAPHTFMPMGKNGSRLSTFDISNDTREPAPKAATKAPAAKKSEPKSAPRPATPPPPPPPVQPPPVPRPAPVEILRLSDADVAQLDRTMQTKAPRGDDQPQQQSADAGSTVSGAGDTPSSMGPNGQRLYAAEWVREPTHQELAFYLPKTGYGPGWAEIACRTVARFRVEDCEILGDSPAGSGLGRAMQAAAWQFLVRPPRVGGHTLVGEWVRIRITFSDNGR